MSEYAYTLNAVIRNDQGKGASRRLRHQGLVPAIVYGGDAQPLSIAVDQNELVKLGRFDSFYSQIINLKIEGQKDQEVIVRAVQRHIFKPLFQHIDLQRVVAGQELHATISLHFLNEGTCKGVKESGGIIDRHLLNLDVICHPRNLPAHIDVDLANVGINESLHGSISYR